MKKIIVHFRPGSASFDGVDIGNEHKVVLQRASMFKPTDFPIGDIAVVDETSGMAGAISLAYQTAGVPVFALPSQAAELTALLNPPPPDAVIPKKGKKAPEPVNELPGE